MAKKRTERVWSEYYPASDYAEGTVKNIWRMMANVAAQDKDGTTVELKTHHNGWEIIVWREIDDLCFWWTSDRQWQGTPYHARVSLLRMPG